MKERIYEVRLTESTSIQIEQQQTLFMIMSKVFDLAHESGLIGHGIAITWLNAGEAVD